MYNTINDILEQFYIKILSNERLTVDDYLQILYIISQEQQLHTAAPYTESLILCILEKLPLNHLSRITGAVLDDVCDCTQEEEEHSFLPLKNYDHLIRESKPLEIIKVDPYQARLDKNASTDTEALNSIFVRPNVQLMLNNN